MTIAGSLFSTQELPPARRYDRFREAVSATHLPWDMGPRPSGAFDARIDARGLGEASVIACRCDPCAGRRRAPEIGRADRAMVGILCVLEGRERVAHRGRDARLETGSWTLWDSAEPLAFAVSERLRKVTLLVPQDALNAAVPEARRWLGAPLDARSGGAALFVAHLRALHRTAPQLSARQAALGLRTALDLLAAALPARAGAPAPRLAEIEAHVRRRLPDPDLDADAIARALGVSRRHLDRLFAGTGRTLGRWIWRERAARAARDLVLEPRARVIDVAFRWGFSDAAHFSRVFRRELGVSPRTYRRRALTASTSGKSGVSLGQDADRLPPHDGDRGATGAP